MTRRLPLPARALLATLAFGSLVRPAFAHGIWAEMSKEHRVTLKFGDFGKRVEKSPGALDRIAGIKAWTFDAEGKPVPATIEKNADHLLLKDASADGAVFAELTALPPRAHGKGPVSQSNFYIRRQPAGSAASAPALTLDIVPAEKPGTLIVYLRGKPLAGAKLEVFAPGAKEPAEATTDAEGRATFDATAPGAYVFECFHKEPLGGFRDGIRYETTGHVAALTLTVASAK